jgi:hypothetical protein
MCLASTRFLGPGNNGDRLESHTSVADNSSNAMVSGPMTSFFFLPSPLYLIANEVSQVDLALHTSVPGLDQHFHSSESLGILCLFPVLCTVSTAGK